MIYLSKSNEGITFKLQEESMLAIVPIEDLRAAQKELLETKDIEELNRIFQKVASDRMEKHLQTLA